MGGGPRVDRLCRYLDNYDPHAVDLTEWRNNRRGLVFEKWAKDRAMQCIGIADGRTSHGVFIASRAKVEFTSMTPVGCGEGKLMQADCADFTMLECYFPQRKVKAVFFDQCSQVIASHRGKPFILIGDLNTGNQIADRCEEGARYFCAEGFDRLCRSGELVDLWRSTHADAREWSWLFKKTATGFRIDHALANMEFVKWSAPVCSYDHSTRISGMTDHSALIIEIRADPD
jgi:exonuclease III